MSKIFVAVLLSFSSVLCHADSTEIYAHNKFKECQEQGVEISVAEVFDLLAKTQQGKCKDKLGIDEATGSWTWNSSSANLPPEVFMPNVMKVTEETACTYKDGYGRTVIVMSGKVDSTVPHREPLRKYTRMELAETFFYETFPSFKSKKEDAKPHKIQVPYDGRHTVIEVNNDQIERFTQFFSTPEMNWNAAQLTVYADKRSVENNCF